MSNQSRFAEKIAYFADLIRPAVLKSYTFFDTTRTYQMDEPRLIPLKFKICNAGYPWSFSEAFIQYTKYVGPNFMLDSWHKHHIFKLMDVLGGVEEMRNFDRKSFECLFDLEENHVKCLRTLLSRNNNKLDIAAVMAHHYFKPLLPDSTYVLDTSYTNKPTKCKQCQQELVYGDTTVGNKKVWHGKVDILLKTHDFQTSIKVNSEEEFSKSDTAEPFLPDHDEEDAHEDNVIPFREVEERRENKKKIKSQFLAEAIVNAFYFAKYQSKSDQFIPSFLITEKYIRMVFYNVKLDILLKCTKMNIWEDENTLNFMTLIRVWLVLNYSCTMPANDMYEYLLLQTGKCYFKDLLLPESYQIYLNEIQQPCKIDDNLNPKVKDNDNDDDVNMEAAECDREELISFYQYVRKRLKLSG